MLLEGAPQREIQQRLSLARGVRIEQGLTRRRPRHGEDELQRRAFRGPRRIAVDAFGVRVRRCDLPSKSVEPGSVGCREVRRLADVLGTHIQRGEEAPRRRQVR